MMDISAHNTANMDTDGFKRQTIKLDEGTEGGVVVTLGEDKTSGGLYQSNGKFVESSNVNYADEAVSQMSAKHFLSANIAAFKTAEEMEKSLIDIKA